MKLIKAKDLKVGDELIVYLDHKEKVTNKVTEVEPNTDHRREVGILFEDVTWMIFLDPDAEFILISHSRPEDSNPLDLAWYSANLFVQEILSTYSDKCARTPRQNTEIRKLAAEAHNAIDDYLMGLPEKDRPARSESDVNDGNPEGW